MSAGSTFDALAAAMRAVVREDSQAFEQALRDCRPHEMLGHAVRHKCTGYLLQGLLRYGMPAHARALADALKQHAKSALLQSVPVRSQLDGIVAALNEARVDHAFLKSGALLYENDDDARWTPVFDLDVLVRRADGARAFDVLRAAGYACDASPKLRAYYEQSHHHLAPLDPPGEGKPLEIHVALALPGKFAASTDWSALAPDLSRYPGANYTYRLNDCARAWHLLLHGAGLQRLADIVRIARILRAEETVLERLARRVAAENRSRPVLAATLRIASEFAERAQPDDRDAEAFVRWMFVREGLPEWLRTRSQAMDAWYESGYRLRETCRRAFPPVEPEAPPRWFGDRAFRLAGRGVAAAIAAGYVAARR